MTICNLAKGAPRRVSMYTVSVPVFIQHLNGLTLFSTRLPVGPPLTAYDILRQCGMEIGKRDFMGSLPT
jgi:hypothetical protein